MEYYAFFWEMGGGKTKITLDTAAMLYLNGKIDGLLVFAPKGAYLNWVFEEIDKHMTDMLDYRVAYWSASPRKAEKAAIKSIMVPDPECLDIFVVNTEAMSHKSGYGAAKEFVKSHKCLTCVDESTDIKTPKSKRTKSIMFLRDLSPYRRILTGTPITQSPLDLYSQCQFLKKGSLGHNSFLSFKNDYAIIMQMRMGTRTFPKITGYRNIDRLKKLVAPFSSRILKEDCMDLPEKTYSTEYVEMTAEQLTAYNDMRETCVAMFEEDVVTVTSALTAIVKLQQIVCGHIKTEDGKVIDIPNNRLTAMVDIINRLPNDKKVIIWCHFQRDVQQVTKTLADEFGKNSAVHFYGETNDKDRVLNKVRFNDEPECRFMVASSAGSKGNTWVSSHNVIYFSSSYNLMTRLQSEDRCHRHGQSENVLYTDLISRNTVDEKIVKALRDKKDVANMVLDDLRKIVM